VLGGDRGIYTLRQGEAAAQRRLAVWSGQILGIRPDPASGTFLACLNDPERGLAQVVRHDLARGTVRATYALPASSATCNDIALLPDGRFAVTDSSNSQVYILRGSALVPLPLARAVIFANGIAADPASFRLFIAGANGIFVHELETDSGWELETSPTTASAIDGLVWHEGSLIGVQNQTSPPRLLRIRPDPGGRTAEVEVLAADQTLLAGSTTVAVAGDHAFVISRTNGAEGRETPFLVRVPL
jgi:hypothetical protein